MSSISNLCELVDHGLQNYSGIVASTKRKGAWHNTDINIFRAHLNACAAGFYSLGVRNGDRVAIHSENRTEWLLIDYALLSLGATSVPIYTTQPQEQILYILKDANVCGYVVSSKELYDRCPPNMMSESPSLKWILGINDQFSSEMTTFSDLIIRGEEQLLKTPDLITESKAAVQSEDLATICYTSGTTGQPKGVMLTHRNLTTNALSVADRLTFDVPCNVLSFLPLSHSFERIASLFYVSKSCSIFFIETPDELIDDIQYIRPRHMTTVPRLLEKVHAGVMTRAIETKGVKGMLARWAFNKAENYDVENPTSSLSDKIADSLVYKKARSRVFGGNLKAITSGGAALSPRVQSFINGLGIYCGQGYGLTETSPVITLYEQGKLRSGSVGTPIDGVEVNIADDGEILTRGPHIMSGYLNLSDETAQTITEDGWLHTGDIGKIDDQGYLYITDRKKQLFKLSTGKYIAPAPIEVSLASSALIEHAVVLGPDFKFCAALIVVDAGYVKQAFGESPNHSFLEREVQTIIDRVNEGLPPWEQVKKFHVITEPFTIDGGQLTPTLKVRRKNIFTQYSAEIEALYAS